MKFEKYQQMSSEDVFDYLDRLAKKCKTDLRGLVEKANFGRMNAWRWENRTVKPTFGSVVRMEQAVEKESV